MKDRREIYEDLYDNKFQSEIRSRLYTIETALEVSMHDNDAEYIKMVIDREFDKARRKANIHAVKNTENEYRNQCEDKIVFGDGTLTIKDTETDDVICEYRIEGVALCKEK